MHWARVGMKVECVFAGKLPDQRNMRQWLPGSAIKEGGIYTVRQIGIDTSGDVGLRLYEVVLRARQYPHKEDLFYSASRFRPLVTRSTDTGMAILRSILDGTKHDHAVKKREPVKAGGQ